MFSIEHITFLAKRNQLFTERDQLQMNFQWAILYEIMSKNTHTHSHEFDEFGEAKQKVEGLDYIFNEWK